MSMNGSTPTITTDPASQPIRNLSVAVIGTGFSGLGMAIRLVQDGETDFLVFEKADDVGGTWRENSYPGCACDVQAHLYSYSFAPNPGWEGTYGQRDELFTYLRKCADDFGVRPYIRFGHELTNAVWDAESQRWWIETSKGLYTASVLVSAMGYLSDPNIPAIKGLESFDGPVFHSSQWKHDVDLFAKNVAVIGTGASAIQFVPEIQPEVAQLSLYQRTPPWVGPKPHKTNEGATSWALHHVPGYQRFRRNFNKWGREILAFTMKRPAIMKKMTKMSSGHLDALVDDPGLKAQLTPDYIMGCKRMLFSNTYYPALTRETTEVVSDDIDEILPHSIRTTDGSERPTDVIILGTGFRPTNRAVAHLVKGVGGKTLGDAWQKGQSAYLGTAIPDFPNFFMILGPSTALAHSAMTLMSEAQIAYISDFLKKRKRQSIGTIEVRPEALGNYVEQVQKYAAGSVWNTGGCTSWYLDDAGQNTTMWPTYTWRFRKATRNFNLSDYETEPARYAESV